MAWRYICYVLNYKTLASFFFIYVGQCLRDFLSVSLSARECDLELTQFLNKVIHILNWTDDGSSTCTYRGQGQQKLYILWDEGEGRILRFSNTFKRRPLVKNMYFVLSITIKQFFHVLAFILKFLEIILIRDMKRARDRLV